MSSLGAPAWSRSCRIARAVSAEAPPGGAPRANEGRASKGCGISSLSWCSSPPRFPVARAGKDNPLGDETRAHWRLDDVLVNVRFAAIYGARSSLGAGVAKKSL